VLVQCKQWRREAVTVDVVRGMYGLLCAESASRVVIATTGDFTPDARAFADGKPIELLNGRRLEHMVFGARNAPSVAPPRAPVGAAGAPRPACPLCGAAMVLRTAKRGANAGNSFYGCSHYPQCRGIVQTTRE